MNNIKWIKIACNIFDDEAIKLIEQMPESDSIIVIWLKLLISAGKINDSGLVYFKKEIPYTDEMLSAVFNRPINIIRLAISTFEKFGMIQITDEHQIFITNWEEHQNIEKLDKIRKDTRARVSKYREKQRLLLQDNSNNNECNATCNVTVTQCNAQEEERRKKKEDEEKEEEKKKNFVAKSFFQKLIADDEELKEFSFLKDLFIEFLEYKTQIKKQFKTEKGVKNAFIDFVRLSKKDINYARALVDNAIARGWQSIYELPAEQKRAFEKEQRQSRQVNDENYGGF